MGSAELISSHRQRVADVGPHSDDNDEKPPDFGQDKTKFPQELHGKPLRTYHERPFRLEQDGQSIVGSIDLVWQTAEGNIVVDYKTNPMGPKAVLNPENEHFVGWYAGQLEAYQAALEAAGEKVIKRYIYYPVNGLLVELAD